MYLSRIYVDSGEKINIFIFILVDLGQILQNNCYTYFSFLKNYFQLVAFFQKTDKDRFEYHPFKFFFLPN